MSIQRDPHDIAPDWLFEEYDGLEDARDKLEPTTDTATLTRCPECASINITPKSDTIYDIPHRKTEQWRCNSSRCYAHFDTPAPSAAEEGVPEHDGCGRRLHVRYRPGNKDCYCHRCGESFNEEGER
jgi:hypothetical protein